MALLDEHLNSQHWLSYTVRGPEWAFAVPEGDLEALEDIMRRCSSFWNGAGSLIVPVRTDGRIPRVIDTFLNARPVDACFWHESLGERARAGLERKIGGAQRLWDGFDRHEIHPLDLVKSDVGDTRPPMRIPRLTTARMRRAVLALWGHIPDEELPYWEEKFDISTPTGNEAHVVLTNGQIEPAGESPLRCSRIHMHMLRSAGIDAIPYVWVLPDTSFNSLISFWNFRSRTTAPANGASVVGVLRESLGHPERIAALTQWIPRVPGRKTVPDAFIACGGALREEVRAGLAATPMTEDPDRDKYGSETILSGGGVEHNDTPTFGFIQPYVAASFVRGSGGSVLVAFVNGKSSTALPVPESFKVRSFRHARVIYDNLPLPLPLTEAMARRVHRDATVHDGVMLLTTATGPWAFPIRLPTAEEALHDWLGGHGFTIQRTGESRDAKSILSRLRDLDGLDALANRKRIAVLDVLAPKPPKKLAQHIVAQARQAGANLSEETMVELLVDSRVFLQTEARTATDIGSAIHERRPAVLDLLAPLVAAGFVRRGHAIECPQCRFLTTLSLGEADEHVRCGACGQEFQFPTAINGEEPPVSYRLDGLMASAMAWDVVPVLLTLRAAHKRLRGSPLFYTWPELTVTPPGETRAFNIDLLVSTGRDVWCYEVKLSASGLNAPQFERLLKVCSQLRARPGIAALNGDFDSEMVRRVNEAGGQVFWGSELAP